MRRSLASLILAWKLLAPGLASQRAEAIEITPADVLVEVKVVRAELELLRLELGKPNHQDLNITIHDAEPREVFFQALVLFEKSDRLCFEQLREREKLPAQPSGTIRPADVLGVVRKALARIQRVKAKYQIPEKVERTRPIPDTKPTDVFRAILQANRLVNLLLDKPFTPSDVYREVSVALAYTSRLLKQFPNKRRPMAVPQYKRRKQPRDVYIRLLECHRRIREIGEISGLSMLEARLDPDKLRMVSPGEVYDIAALLVSELNYLDQHRPERSSPPRGHYPGRKIPSDVYQRAGMLLARLESLKELAQSHPKWLKSEGEAK